MLFIFYGIANVYKKRVILTLAEIFHSIIPYAHIDVIGIHVIANRSIITIFLYKYTISANFITNI